MRIPLSKRLRALFAGDKEAFWFRQFTDEELKLRRMNVWELAAVIEDPSDLVGIAEKKIVAEHMLNVRLAQIQSKASWGAGLLGFVGAIIGAALSVALTSIFQGQAPPSSAPAALSSSAMALQGATQNNDSMPSGCNVSASERTNLQRSPTVQDQRSQ